MGDGILNYYRNWTTSAAIESLHSKLQLARSRARGFRNFDYFRTIAYWIAGGLTPGSGLPTEVAREAEPPLPARHGLACANK